MAEYCKVLIVDDELIMRQGIKYLLNWEEEGFQIVGDASNGKDALEKMAQLKPHIVLCDIVMPIMDGIDFSSVAKKIYPETQIIILSGYDNFEYVKGALKGGASDYILKPELNPQELLTILKKTAEKIPGLLLVHGEEKNYANILERYLTGECSEEEGTKLRGYFSHTFFRAAFLNLSKAAEDERNLPGILYEKIQDFWEEKKEMLVLSIHVKENLVGIVLNYGAKDRKKSLEELKRMTEQLEIISPHVLCVAGKEEQTLEEMKRGVREQLLEEADRGFYYQGRHLVLLENENRQEPEYKRFDFAQYTHLLSSKKWEEAITMLGQYIHEALETGMDEFRIKNQAKNMVYSFLESTEMEGKKKDQLRYEIFKRMDKTRYKDEFETVFLEVESMLCEQQRQPEERNDRRIANILAYLSEHYHEDLNLMELSRQFGFNYYYLSAYFSQHMSESFSDYLNRIRIRRACELLRDKNISVSEISGMVGYSDHSYFCRVFKKIVGETPTSYRRKEC